ncbi:MAG: hypothetical protein GKR90_22260 [Pseudomonadales bacterium]|nr:hypothetical protein [Pseudomonadales bacterium]
MKRYQQFRRVLFQFAVLVFTLNTVTAAGACCFAIDDEAVESVPCHQSEDNSAAEAEDDCCLVCMTVVCPEEESITAVVPAMQMLPIAIIVSATNNLDPPYRPPIHYLS